jgi:hypothetical protein
MSRPEKSPEDFQPPRRRFPQHDAPTQPQAFSAFTLEPTLPRTLRKGRAGAAKPVKADRERDAARPCVPCPSGVWTCPTPGMQISRQDMYPSRCFPDGTGRASPAVIERDSRRGHERGHPSKARPSLHLKPLPAILLFRLFFGGSGREKGRERQSV